MTAWMKPSQIRYCQENIDGKFGRQHNTSLLEVFRKLLYDECEPKDFPPIVVVRYEDDWYVYDGHRRLFLFKKLEEAGKITEIKVHVKNLWKEKFEERFDTISDGRSIRIRHPPNLLNEIDFCVFQYKEEIRLKHKNEQNEQLKRCNDYIDGLNYSQWLTTALKAAVVIFYSNKIK